MTDLNSKSSQELGSILKSIGDIRDAVDVIKASAAAQREKDEIFNKQTEKVHEAIRLVEQVVDSVRTLLDTSEQIAKVQQAELAGISQQVATDIGSVENRLSSMAKRQDEFLSVLDDTHEGTRVAVLDLLDNMSELKKSTSELRSYVTSLRTEVAELSKTLQDQQKNVKHLSAHLDAAMTEVGHAFSLVREEMKSLREAVLARRRIIPTRKS